MEKTIRIIIGALIFGGSIWWAIQLEKPPELGSIILDKNTAVSFISADGKNKSAKFDSTLFSEKPHLLMSDGHMTLNNTCPVRKARLNTRIQPLFVNGRSIGFC